MNIPHIPVLLEEVTRAFSAVSEGVIVDCTLGYGGHSEAILEANPRITLVGCDKDAQAVAFAQKRLARFGERVRILHAPFSTVISHIDPLHVRGILADIGVSSLQLDRPERGFGFESDVLDMRMDTTMPLTAYEVVNTYTQAQLEEILREYGELPQWRVLAERICKAREIGPITSAKVLAEIVGRGRSQGRKVSPATLVFQAIRIEVNDELGELGKLLRSIETASLHDCVVGIISFHSLEDRIVKQTFKLWQKECICNPFVPRCECGGNHSLGKILTKKPIEPSPQEVQRNPRSRSSKLRLFRIEQKRVHE
ncbi:MAG: 16S rRNA (cytosine(1402)-N(4))-methyltransferase RsmH [Campylobacterales bacterium]|nr:16S rRNA (cytosine(1402)-N(4))-methyltransferase RsmH [Campylobacterales bacterium]